MSRDHEPRSSDAPIQDDIAALADTARPCRCAADTACLGEGVALGILEAHGITRRTRDSALTKRSRPMSRDGHWPATRVARRRAARPCRQQFHDWLRTDPAVRKLLRLSALDGLSMKPQYESPRMPGLHQCHQRLPDLRLGHGCPGRGDRIGLHDEYRGPCWADRDPHVGHSRLVGMAQQFALGASVRSGVHLNTGVLSARSTSSTLRPLRMNATTRISEDAAAVLGASTARTG